MREMYADARGGVCVVLYHQPEKMVKAAENLAERLENLERLKRVHGIE